MKVLKIKVQYQLKGEEKTAEVTIPYELEKGFDLPKIYPFTQNVYFGPDSGTYLGRIYIDKDGNLSYVDGTVVLVDGKAHYSPFNHDLYVFDFEVVEQ